MKRILLATAISLAFLSTAAMAKDHGNGNGNGHGYSNHSRGDGDRRDGDHGDGERDGRRYYRQGHRWQARHRVHHDNGLHLGQYKFARGERVPDMYRQPRYYVEDYRVYHLAPPPRGYRWVRPDDGRYLLISTATGLISQILGY